MAQEEGRPALLPMAAGVTSMCVARPPLSAAGVERVQRRPLLRSHVSSLWLAGCLPLVLRRDLSAAGCRAREPPAPRGLSSLGETCQVVNSTTSRLFTALASRDDRAAVLYVPMRVFAVIGGTGALITLGFLGFRVQALGQRVAALTALTGNRSEDVDAAPRSRPGAGQDAQLASCEQRLAGLEKRVDALRNDVRLHASASSSGASVPAVRKEEAILSVVAREQDRIRDVQVEWHKPRLRMGREKQLAEFAEQNGLRPAQTAELRTTLQDEIDAMVKVWQRPDFAEDPDQVAADWLKLLAETDKRAARALTPEQQQAWTQARLFERRLLWPWLPESAAGQK